MRRFSSILAVLLCSVLPAYAGSTMAKVKSVVNGSTLMCDVRGKETLVHLHGVATPDPNDARPALKQLGQEAVDYLTEYLKSGWIYLEYPDGKPVPDKDGVVPAYVYRGHDATFVNQQLIMSGMGVVNRKLQFEHRESLLEHEARAKGAMRGIWGSFSDGSGKKIAAGNSHQGTYIGEIAPNAGRRTNDVIWVWIIEYW